MKLSEEERELQQRKVALATDLLIELQNQTSLLEKIVNKKNHHVCDCS